MFEIDNCIVEKNIIKIQTNKDAILDAIRSLAKTDSKMHSDDHGVFIKAEAVVKFDFENEELSIMF